MGLRRRRNREEIENVFEEMIHENFPNLKKETHIQVQKACVCMLVHFSRVQLFVTLWTIAHQSPLSMGSPDKNTGVGSHSLLQEIFLTQGLNLARLHCRQIIYCLSHQRKLSETIANTYGRLEMCQTSF